MDILTGVAAASLAIAGVCALVIAVDVVRHPQSMSVMNFVWPLTGLYGSVFALWAYWLRGRERAGGASMQMGEDGGDRQPPTGWQVSVATSHCAAGCVAADIVVEWGLFALGVTLWRSTLWASYLYDYLAAWSLGVIVQYASIQPRKHLSVLGGLSAAIQADTLSITAFQIGMYGWMAVVYFVLFPHRHLHPNEPAYWFMMQLAMLAGFATAWPTNRWLVRTGRKDRM